MSDKIRRPITLTAACLLLAMTLTGCVKFVDESEVPQSGGSSQSEQSGNEEVQESDEGSSSDEQSSDEDQEAEREPVEVGSETGVQYARAVQAFSPQLEIWTIDIAGGVAEYDRYNCVGMLVDSEAGALTARDDADRYEVTWDGDSPMRTSFGPSERLTITDRSLKNGIDTSVADTERETQRFVGMCKSAGEGIIDFVF